MALDNSDSSSNMQVASRQPSLNVEMVSYLGVALVVASGGLWVGRIWQDLNLYGRLGVAAGVAVLGLTGGWALTRMDDSSAERLGWFLWLCGTGGVAMFTAVLVDDRTGRDVGWIMFSTGLAVLTVSLLLWRNLERPLQFLSFVIGLHFSVVGFTVLYDLHLSYTTAGLLVWGVSFVLGALALTFLHPTAVALVVAELGVLSGAASVTDSYRALGIGVGLASATVSVAVGLGLNRWLIVAIGAIGFFAYVLTFLVTYLSGTGAFLGAFAIGIALVVAAMWRGTHGVGSPQGPHGIHWHHHQGA